MRILLKMMMEAFLWKEWWLRGWVLRRNSFRSMAQARNWHYWTSNPYANKMSDSLWCRIEDMDLLSKKKKRQLEEGRTETHSLNQFDQWKRLNGKRLSSSKTLPSFLSMTLYEISVYFCKLVCVYIEHTLHSTAQDIHSFFLNCKFKFCVCNVKGYCVFVQASDCVSKWLLALCTWEKLCALMCTHLALCEWVC